MDGTAWEVSTPANRINANANSCDMFSGHLLTSIDFGDNFNTSNVTNMNSMFLACGSLPSLNLSNFNTDNVASMSMMLLNRSSLISLNLFNFNTSNVNDMRYMFRACHRLTSFNLYNFNMSALASHTDGGTTYSGKHQMCFNLAYTSGACAITCPKAIQTELQSGTGLDNSRITWYTH